jgi:hypothetical protein
MGFGRPLALKSFCLSNGRTHVSLPLLRFLRLPVTGQSRLVGTPRCGVRTAQRAVPTLPGPPSLTDYDYRHI